MKVLGRVVALKTGQRWVILLLAYVPLLLNDPGRVAADTKAYLYLDPGRLLERATSMWQPEVAMGTVTHQNIGYLWPIGPFYWISDILGLPDWVAQRLWLGTVLALAGLGVRWLLRTLRWSEGDAAGGGVLVASLAYMLSPYLLNYVDRHSVILLPWAGLPWMIGLTVRAVRTGGWRHPAAFGLVTMTIGGVNASSLLLVGLGPAVWLIWCGLERSVSWRRIVGTAARMGLAFTATGLWWMVGLVVQAQHGLPTLRLTENYRVVSDAATGPELFRGLGYWYFYGQGRLGAWIEPATSYTRWALPLSFALPLLALMAVALVRFRHRGHVLALIVVGILVGIGAHPYDSPSLLGRVFREWTLSDMGLALRSTPRALPLSVLGLAICLGAGVAALARWRPRIEPIITAAVCILVVANLSPLWRGEMLGSLVQRPEDVPAAWHDAADYLDARGVGTRVLEVPGADFAAYRWGNSGDPVLPGLMDRHYVARELIPQGSQASAALLVALDTEIQEGRLDKDALAPMARLMGVGDVVLRSDLQFERFRTPRPSALWADIQGAPGFGEPVEFGEPVPNVAGPERPLIDQHTLSKPLDAVYPAPVIVLPVANPTPILRTADSNRPILVSGDAAGIVAAAGEGLLDPARPLFLTGSFADAPSLLAAMVRPETRIILTDSNRKSGRRWGTIRETEGYIERADEEPMNLDLSDYVLSVIADRPGVQTVSAQSGIKVDASGYGNPVTFTPGDRPFHAVDGDPTTAWSVGAFNNVVGERFVLTLQTPAVVEYLTIQQSELRGQNRWITDLAIGVDDQPLEEVKLDVTSRLAPGQRIRLPGIGEIARITLEIRATDVGPQDNYAGFSGVGFAEVSIDGIEADETIVLPTDLPDLIEQAGLKDLGAETVVVLTRRRSDPRDPIRTEPEVAMDRTFKTPWDRSFDLRGEARLSTYAPDNLFYSFLGDPAFGTATGTASLSGDLGSRPRSAFDGDTRTAWQPPIGPQENQSVTLTSSQLRLFEDLVLTYRADGLHSAPSRVTIFSDQGPVGSVDLPGTLHSASTGVIDVALPVPAFTGYTLGLRVDSVVERLTMNWYSGLPDVLPVAIVEIAFNPERGESNPRTGAATPAVLDTGCRSDLLLLDNVPLAVRISGSTSDALDRRPLTVELCDGPLSLFAGVHRLQVRPGAKSGFDLDRLVLQSFGSQSVTSQVSDRPFVQVDQQARTSLAATAFGADGPFWLVLGQSYSDAWRLELAGATVGGKESGIPPVLIDGYANGWLVTPTSDKAITLNLRWTPQRLVASGLGLSLVATLLCVLIAVCGRRDATTGDSEPPAFESGTRRATNLVPCVMAALSSVLIGIFALVNLPTWWWIAPLLGISSWAALRGLVARRTSTFASVLFMGFAAGWIAVDQIRFRFPRDFVWPLFFEQTHVLGVVSVLFLAGAAVEALVERRVFGESDAGVGEVTP
ncbi:MAG: alpha-(1-_3)-arabinofuranosyltransferase family protein [Acidimicrobiales bacterium]|nr:alpha-(1->3)-arabinofuranosyltransferase family protein [Acidimicrobiales bacterium]